MYRVSDDRLTGPDDANDEQPEGGSVRSHRLVLYSEIGWCHECNVGDAEGFRNGLASGAVYLLWRAHALQSRHRALMLYLLLATFGLLFMMTPLAAPLCPWYRQSGLKQSA